jgi:O-Antigen ligase
MAHTISVIERSVAGKNEPLKKGIFVIVVIALMSYFPAILSYLRIFYILIFLAFCAFLYALRFGSKARREALRSSRYILGFFAYLALTAVWAQFPGRTLTAVAIDLIFVLVWGLFFALELTYKEEEIARLFVYVPWIVAATFVYLLARFGALRPFDEDSSAEIGATANICGQWLVMSLPFIYWLIRRGDRRRYIELCLTLFLIAVAQSRTAYVLALFLLAAEAYVYAKNFRHFLMEGAKFAVILVLLVASAWVLPTTRPLVADGFQRVALTQNDDETDYDIERRAMLLVGWEAFTERPWLGIGYHNLGERIGEVFSREIESHNILLTLIAECGWPALILFCLLIGEFFKRTGWAKAHLPIESSGFYAACQISLITGLVTGMTFPLLELPLFYVVLGLGYASAFQRREPAQVLSSHARLNAA